ncbi:MAG: HAMP domain-containing histidine kinase [Spirochaetales bacterium]|nr:HAMP domain-containing histidine kinase [Spirochaetales bacterium]
MKSLFARITLAFLGVQLLFIIILSVIFFIGFQGSVNTWQSEKDEPLRLMAKKILEEPGIPAVSEIPGDTPFFVYDAGKNLVFSYRDRADGRGMGMHRMDQQFLEPIYGVDGRLIGYFSSSPRRFYEDQENANLVGSMTLVIVVDLVIATAVGVGLMFLFSRSLAKPALLLSRRLDAMAAGDLLSPVPVSGASEIVSIAHSARRLGEELSAEKTARARWSQDLAHDLRTPISAMRAQFEGMLDGVLPIDKSRIEKNHKELLRLEDLVMHLEELIKLESSEMLVNNTIIEIPGLFHDIIERFAHDIKKQKIDVSQNIHIQNLSADVNLLQRALFNIFANAIRHVEKNGKIILSSEKKDEKILLSVFNSGSFIPRDEQEKVFDRLYRGEYARTTPGSGLGLTIVKQIAELHKGTANIDSREGWGTRVSLMIPENQKTT